MENLQFDDFFGVAVETEGVEMMLDERVVPFGTALWS